MFEAALYDDLLALCAQVAGARTELATTGQQAAALKAIQACQDLLDGAKATTLMQFDEAEGYVEDGASSIKVWAKTELRLDTGQAGRLVRAGQTMRALPQVGDALAAGVIRLDHVHAFSAGLVKAGADLVEEAQPWLLEVARTCEPGELKDVLNSLAEVVHSDRLDDAYARGMDKHDLQISRVGDGFHLSGFLDIVTGTMVKTWLDRAAAPRCADDPRTPAQRRSDALHDTIDAILQSGMPTDHGVRPHLIVNVGADRLTGDPLAEPAELAGFGPIGDQLLAQLTCTADFTAFLTDGHTDGPTPQQRVLYAGRSHRLATHKQRLAIHLRQAGVCAAPGCTNTHLELHHVLWWERDHGPTNLDNLIGLCSRCHHLVHADKLFIRTDHHGGWTFSRSGGRIHPDHHRTRRAHLRQHLRRLRHTATSRPETTAPPAPTATTPRREPADRASELPQRSNPERSTQAHRIETTTVAHHHTHHRRPQPPHRRT